MANRIVSIASLSNAGEICLSVVASYLVSDHMDHMVLHNEFSASNRRNKDRSSTRFNARIFRYFYRLRKMFRFPVFFETTVVKRPTGRGILETSFYYSPRYAKKRKLKRERERERGEKKGTRRTINFNLISESDLSSTLLE